MHAICVFCGSPYCTCFDTDEEYAQAIRELQHRTSPPSSKSAPAEENARKRGADPVKVSPETTVAELQRRFPGGFSVGPGSPEMPGELSRVLAASSYLSKIAGAYPLPPANGVYLVVDMDEPACPFSPLP